MKKRNRCWDCKWLVKNWAKMEEWDDCVVRIMGCSFSRSTEINKKFDAVFGDVYDKPESACYEKNENGDCPDFENDREFTGVVTIEMPEQESTPWYKFWERKQK
jgi:hypothetical protein